jgi:hypothetical protein
VIASTARFVNVAAAVVLADTAREIELVRFVILKMVAFDYAVADAHFQPPKISATIFNTVCGCRSSS